MDGTSYTLGLLLIVSTIAIHTTAVVLMAFAGARIRVRIEKRQLAPLRVTPLVICHLGGVALILVAVHGLEATLWAAGYAWLGAFGSFRDALVYSNGMMTSLGVTGLDIPSRWQILSTVDAVNAMLLFGISTAFLFAMLQDYWPLLSRRDSRQQR